MQHTNVIPFPAGTVAKVAASTRRRAERISPATRRVLDKMAHIERLFPYGAPILEQMIDYPHCSPNRSEPRTRASKIQRLALKDPGLLAVIEDVLDRMKAMVVR